MTKYVFHSGSIDKSDDKGRAFFNEILNGLGDEPKLLICQFAEKKKHWRDKFETYSENIRNFVECSPNISLADPFTFKDQVANSDAVYVHGGDNHLMRYWFSQFELEGLFNEVVYAGSSAGVSILSNCFWSQSWDRCLEGLDVLPFKFMAHYNAVEIEGAPTPEGYWRNAYEKLSAFGDKSLPIYKPDEGTFITLDF